MPTPLENSTAARDAVNRAQGELVAADAALDALVAQLQLPPPPPPPPPGITPVYVADFETGDFRQCALRFDRTLALYADLTTNTPGNRTQVVTDGIIGGNHSAKIIGGPSDTNVAGSGGNIKTQVVFKGSASRNYFGGASLEGRHTWLTWDMRIDPAFDIPTTPAWCVLFEWADGLTSPTFAIEAPAPAGVLNCVLRGGSLGGNYRVLPLLNPLPRDSITRRFKAHHFWSVGAGGLVEIWVNGVRKVTNSGPNLYTGRETVPYGPMAGVYRSPGGVTRDSWVMIDNLREWLADPGAGF